MIDKILFVSFLYMWAVLFDVQAQKVTYAYDSNGNRISREFVLGSNKSATLTEESDISPLIDGIDNYEIKIFPNPTHGILRVDIEGMDDETFTIAVYDLGGHLVYHINRAENVNVVDLTRYENGVYVMVIVRGEEKRTWRIIKK